MDKQELLRSVTELSRDGVVTQDEVMEAYREGIDPSIGSASPRMDFSGILSYLGGGIVVLGIAIFIEQHWDTLTTFTKIFSTLGVGILAYWNGVVLSREERYVSFGLAFHLIAALVLLTGFYLASYRIFGKTLFSFWSVVFGTSLFGCVTTYLGEWSTFGLDAHFTSYQFLVIGLTYLSLGHAFLSRREAPLTKYLYAFGLTFFFLSALELGGYAPEQNWFWELIYPGLALGATLLSVPLRSRSFLIVGALALVVYIFKITGEYFSDSFGWPLALVIAGLALIGVGTLFVRLNARRKGYKG